ncbi:hypothetical protein SKAU_G00380570 [Synaphobranchus kaupii]|uniref:Uncharacterized protein n=1 Tax=Synaphobranchus kaupii TaxID=118154 RepID=A0A9Q1EDL5_SYNKA|nr:hypothetical protein SKAU_G00380570 [Synaphobranchus kaupii]
MSGNLLKALQALQNSLLQAEDIVKVHEARLIEKETSSLEPRELEDYRKMWLELDQKRDILKSLEAELGNNQISQSFYKCNVDLPRYSEQVTQMTDRWHRIQSQIDSRACDRQVYELELASYNAGLETLLNIPIKRTILQSPANIVREEASDIQSRYIKLFTHSGDYYKFLGDLMKNMEELKSAREIESLRMQLEGEEARSIRKLSQERDEVSASLRMEYAMLVREKREQKEELRKIRLCVRQAEEMRRKAEE